MKSIQLKKVERRFAITIGSECMTLPTVYTPDEIAKHFGWSPRKLREIAREIGACSIVGNRMMLTENDLAAILEAVRPKPKWGGATFPNLTSEELIRRTRQATPRAKKRRLSEKNQGGE